MVNYSQTYQVLKQQPLFHPVSQSLEPESTLVGWLWLMNFHKVVVKMSFGTKVISLGSTELENHFPSSLTWLLARGNQFLAGSWPQALVLCHVDWTCTRHGSLLPPKWKISERLPKAGCLVKESILIVGNIQT